MDDGLRIARNRAHRRHDVGRVVAADVCLKGGEGRGYGLDRHHALAGVIARRQQTEHAHVRADIQKNEGWMRRPDYVGDERTVAADAELERTVGGLVEEEHAVPRPHEPHVFRQILESWEGGEGTGEKREELGREMAQAVRIPSHPDEGDHGWEFALTRINAQGV
jgi:hypothetical protein